MSDPVSNIYLTDQLGIRESKVTVDNLKFAVKDFQYLYDITDVFAAQLSVLKTSPS